MRPGTIHLPQGTLETAWWGPSPDEAPTLVLLHEGLGSVALWRDFPARLAEATEWGVFAYSRFGYGASDPCALPRPIAYMHDEAQDVLPAVLRAAGIGKAALIGHSDGGSIAAIYAGAAPRPDLLGLVTIAAHFFVEDLNIVSIQEMRTTYETTDLRDRLARWHRHPDVAFQGWNGAWLDPRFRDWNITEYLPRIGVPILAMQGADDPYGSDEQLKVFAAKATAPIETKLIPGAKHSPHLEAKQATLDAVTAFVRDLNKTNGHR